jgi:hypothetical protein
MTFLSVREIATLEQVSERQVQRYISEGYRGEIKLVASRVGKRLVVAGEDYKQWRILCGFDQPEAQPTPAPKPQVSKPAAEREPEVKSMSLPANVNAPLTNVPTAQSGNFASPQTCRAYLEAAAARMKASFLEG